jgi:hypothetical protein
VNANFLFNTTGTHSIKYWIIFPTNLPNIVNSNKIQVFHHIGSAFRNKLAFLDIYASEKPLETPEINF